MISIKKLLNADPDATSPMLRAMEILLQGIVDHAVRGDPEEYLQFRKSMKENAESLPDGAGGSETPMQAAEAVRLLGDYNRRATQQLRRQTALQSRKRSDELESMTEMLAAAIREVSATGKENVSRLRHIEGAVSSVALVKDVRAAKERLSACLKSIHKEAERQELATASAADRWKQNFDRAQASPPADAVTGLPERSQAVELISSACESAQPSFAAVMVIDRLQAVKTAFGPETSDQLLRYLSGQIREGLPSGDQLFHWTGTSLLALVARSIEVEALRREIGLVMARKLEFAVRTATRSLHLPVTARWALFPTTDPAELLIQKLDSFASM